MRPLIAAGPIWRARTAPNKDELVRNAWADDAVVAPSTNSAVAKRDKNCLMVSAIKNQGSAESQTLMYV
jgi:hypothetical protein